MKETWQELPDYSYRGARAMILLQDKHLREFLTVWRRGKTLGVTLPKTDDPSYATYESILLHVLRASRGYLMWLSDKLQLPEPPVKMPPELDAIDREADAYIDQLFACWSAQFGNVPEEKWDGVFTSRWNVEYCLDGMLEHAVMHPIRHSFQIEEWIQQKATSK